MMAFLRVCLFKISDIVYNRLYYNLTKQSQSLRVFLNIRCYSQLLFNRRDNKNDRGHSNYKEDFVCVINLGIN